MKKRIHRAFPMEDALMALKEMEGTASELESSDVFRTFTSSKSQTIEKCSVGYAL